MTASSPQHYNKEHCSDRYVPLRDAADLLHKIISRGKTGIFVLTTEDNRSAYFLLEEGGIRSIAFHATKCMEALKEVLQLTKVHCRFNQNRIINTFEKCMELPDWKDVVEEMKASAPAPGVDADIAGVMFSNKDILPIVMEEASEFLGPMTELVCQEYFQQSKNFNLAELSDRLNRMGKEFRDPAKAEKFKKATLKRVNVVEEMKVTSPAPGMDANIAGVMFSNQDILPIVMEEASEFLGPMTEFVCQEYFQQTETFNLAELSDRLNRMGKEFRDPAKAEKFIKATLKRI